VSGMRVSGMSDPLQSLAGAVASPVIAMSGVRFAWPGRHAFALAIDSFTVQQGERLLLIGPSGSGKSTLLSLLCGILAPQEGRIDILGTDIAKLSNTARDRFRAEHFGIIFQMFNLLPYGSVLDNVALPLSFAKARRERAAEAGGIASQARHLLASLGFDEPLMNAASAAHLSVGQQQRVAAARALIGRPELIVADEPTSALDRNRQVAFLDLLFAEAAAAGSSLVMVSHDETLAPRFDRVADLATLARTTRALAA
jgi:putative ABC transport system ATP-binding protein